MHTIITWDSVQVSSEVGSPFKTRRASIFIMANPEGVRAQILDALGHSTLFKDAHVQLLTSCEVLIEVPGRGEVIQGYLEEPSGNVPAEIVWKSVLVTAPNPDLRRELKNARIFFSSCEGRNTVQIQCLDQNVCYEEAQITLLTPCEIVLGVPSKGIIIHGLLDDPSS